MLFNEVIAQQDIHRWLNARLENPVLILMWFKMFMFWQLNMSKCSCLLLQATETENVYNTDMFLGKHGGAFAPLKKFWHNESSKNPIYTVYHA